MFSCIVITCRFILCLFCVCIIAANIPECEFLNVIELLGQLFYILAQLFLGNLGVHLRGLDVFVTKHGTYCFYWYTIGEANRGCERVPCHVPVKWLGDTAFLSQSFERTQTISIRWYRKDSAILAQSTIFLHYLLGIVKQLDVGFRSCLLSVDNNPLAIVKKCLDVLFLQVVQVNECETCETAK